jgi:hypothetical protein
MNLHSAGRPVGLILCLRGERMIVEVAVEVEGRCFLEEFSGVEGGESSASRFGAIMNYE